MKDIVKPAIVLLIITSVAAALLGAVESITREPIAAATAKTQTEAMQAALPEAIEFKKVEGEFSGTITAVSEGLNDKGESVGYVITANPGGFGGAVPTTVGFDVSGTITGIKVTTPSETPGLGALAAKPEFQDQFKGLSGQIAVDKDGGQVQSITSATITSRAVADGVNEAQTWFAENGGAK